jgi:hypothetical protein
LVQAAGQRPARRSHRKVARDVPVSWLCKPSNIKQHIPFCWKWKRQVVISCVLSSAVAHVLSSWDIAASGRLGRARGPFCWNIARRQALVRPIRLDNRSVRLPREIASLAPCRASLAFLPAGHQDIEESDRHEHLWRSIPPSTSCVPSCLTSRHHLLSYWTSIQAPDRHVSRPAGHCGARPSPSRSVGARQSRASLTSCPALLGKSRRQAVTSISHVLSCWTSRRQAITTISCVPSCQASLATPPAGHAGNKPRASLARSFLLVGRREHISRSGLLEHRGGPPCWNIAVASISCVPSSLA